MTGPSVFSTVGASVRDITTLGWVLTAIAIAVTLIITALLGIALYRRRSGEGRLTHDGEAAGQRWIVIGAAISVVILFAAFVPTLIVLNGYARMEKHAGLTVRVTGYRYWWEAEYLDSAGHRDFVTANELHIPTGVPVRLELRAGDVIHSFWVPDLAGKRDLIPGQVNRMWIEADSAGRWYGQCAEYCGTSHANMRLLVFAETPVQFRQWASMERRPVVASEGIRTLLESHCAACHTIRGTDLRGDAGPDLTHIGSRTTLAAGVMANNAPNLTRWLLVPDSIKPGAMMPGTGLTLAEARAVATYLETLQ